MPKSIQGHRMCAHPLIRACMLLFMIAAITISLLSACAAQLPAEQSGSGEGEAGDNITFEGSQKQAPSDVDSEGNKPDESSQFASIGSKSRENDLPEKAVEDSDGNRFLEGRLTVLFDRSVSEKDAHQIIEQRGGVWGDDSYNNDDGTGIVVVTAYFSGAKNYDDLKAVSLDIAAQEGVIGADIDYTGESEVYGEYHSLQYYLSTSGFENAWSIAICDHQVDIAILDSGFDLDHEDLEYNVLDGYDVVNGCALEQDYVDASGGVAGHGTAVAGVACASAFDETGIDGASANAYYIPIRVSADPKNIPWSNVLLGLSAILSMDNCPDVVNMSFAGRVIPETTRLAFGLYAQSLHNYGTVLVAAAGNQAEDEDSTHITKYPAALDNVVSVSAVDSSNVLSTYSNYNEYVDICAPGDAIYTTKNMGIDNEAYYEVSGTSLAAPQVAAAAALLRALHSDWTASQIEDRLMDTATDLGDVGCDEMYGNGLLNTAAAVGFTDSGSGTSPNTGGSAYAMLLESSKTGR